MHADPGLWHDLVGRLTDMALASLRSQLDAGAAAVQVFDSWAGILAPKHYAELVLPATRRLFDELETTHPDTPTILFGVGTGELLGLMATAGSSVVGVDWRVPLDEARRRVGPDTAVQGNLDPALCLGTWEVAAAETREVLTGPAPPPVTSSISVTGSCPRPTRASSNRSSNWSTGRDGPGSAPRRCVEVTRSVGVLVMAHGTPRTPEGIGEFYTRIRRGRPPTPELLAELRGRYEAIGGTSPLTARTAAQVDGLAAALEAADPGRFIVRLGTKYVHPTIEDGMADLAAAGVDRVVGIVLTPHRSTIGSGEYFRRAGAAAARPTRHWPSPRSPPGTGQLIRPDPGRAHPGRPRRAGPVGPGTDRGLLHRPQPSAAGGGRRGPLSRPGGRVRGRHRRLGRPRRRCNGDVEHGLAERRPDRRRLDRARPPHRDGAGGSRRSDCRGRVPRRLRLTTSRSSTTSTSRHGAGRTTWASPSPAHRPSTTIPRSSPSWPTWSVPPTTRRPRTRRRPTSARERPFGAGRPRCRRRRWGDGRPGGRMGAGPTT